MTPLLDIVFIMLIFFIVTTSFVKESGIDSLRRESNVKPSQDDAASIMISINETGQVFINNRLVDVQGVSASLEFLLADHRVDSVMLSANAQVSHEQVVAVMDQIKDINGLAIAIVSK